MSEVSVDTLLEATLFGAGRSMTVAELSNALGYDADEMLDSLYSLRSTIAYHQPMAQSRLVELLGQKAYDYVRELAQLGMIDRRKDGNTRRLITTRRFSEAFGCPYTDRKKVKQWFREQVKGTGMLDGMAEASVLKEESEVDGLIQSTLPMLEEE